MADFATTYTPTFLSEWIKDKPIKSIPALFDKAVADSPQTPFLGTKVEGTYTYKTYREVAQTVSIFASALIEQGIKAGDRVAQISNNRQEWVITDLATMSCGAVHGPLYATVSRHTLTYILNDSEARLLVAENEEHLSLIKECLEDLTHLEGLISMIDVQADEYGSLKVWTWDEFLSLGESTLEKNSAVIAERKSAIQATDVCSLIYTSGTTGEPKGAMLMHGNFLHNSTCVKPLIAISPGDVELSFLPLSHVFERTLYYLIISIGGTIAYAESFNTVRDNILEVRPHLVASVPRLYEKIFTAVTTKAQNAPTMKRMKRRLFGWALKTGRDYCKSKLSGSVSPFMAAKNALAQKLVFSKIHEAMGGRIKVLASGGAPLRADVCEFFLDAGFTMIEGYGLTETSPVITMNPADRPKIGTVGKTIEAVEIKLAKDNEILTRGPHVMLGYFKKIEATEKSIDKDGWFYTGDIGEIDSDGYLKITDRKKEIIVLSNGKNVAPSPMEQSIKESKFIEQCVVIGDQRNFISALVVPAFESLGPWCKERGISTEPSEMIKDQRLFFYVSATTEKACAEYSHFEQVKKIGLLPRELSQETGELTPTLKTKRRVVMENFKEAIDAIYTARV